MGQPLRKECPKSIFLITTRTINSRLWFVNNKILEKKILTVLARYQQLYNAKIYAFCLMGNHYHLIAQFPKRNKSSFMRAFNSMLAKLTASAHKNFEGGPLWARRYSEQVLPRAKDVKHWFYYCALNPVLSGLVKKTCAYRSYNSIYDAAHSRTLRFKYFRRWQFNEARRWSNKVTAEQFIDHLELNFSRLPDHEDISDLKYGESILSELEMRRAEIVQKRFQTGKDFACKNSLEQTIPGSRPKNTKTSNLYSFRPLILSLCAKTKAHFLKEYFSLREAFSRASKEYLAGNDTVVFPNGTYKPLRVCQAA